MCGFEMESLYFNTSSIRDKWLFLPASERKYVSSTETVRTGRLQVKFCGMSKISRQAGKRHGKDDLENHSKGQ